MSVGTTTGSSSVLLVGSAAAALLMAAAAALMPAKGNGASNGSSSSSGASDILEDEEIITEDLICKIFDRLFLEMQTVVSHLSQQLQQIQMTGQSIPETQVRKLLKGEFERALLARQARVFGDFACDADCVEEATWEFLEKEEEYPKVKRAVERFQKLYDSISGEQTLGRRPGMAPKAPQDQAPVETLPADKLLEAAEAYFGALTNAMRGLVEKFRAAGKDVKQPAVAQELQMEFATIANESGEAALEKLGISLKSFQSSIERNASNPQVGRALAMLQMKQQQELMAMGVIPM